jgi:LmbE family N-acetylglucosaminyl deacetylase
MGRKLMCVVAHPDDECVAFGGALALAAERGVETSVVCLTDGQAATYRGDSKSALELGAIRRAEFAESCRLLGVSRQELLEYQDAQLEFESLSELAGKLVQRMRTFKPQVVVTFGCDGGLNTHPDHMAVSAATTAAFHWAGQTKRFREQGEVYQPQRLFHASTGYFLPDRQPPLPAPWSLVLDVRSVFDRKVEAFQAHASQAPLMEKVGDIWKQHGLTELYTLMATVSPQPARQSTDMFEGVMED